MSLQASVLSIQTIAYAKKRIAWCEVSVSVLLTKTLTALLFWAYFLSLFFCLLWAVSEMMLDANHDWHTDQ
jgi:hypothetical protein